jgi:hypothetical protein
MSKTHTYLMLYILNPSSMSNIAVLYCDEDACSDQCPVSSDLSNVNNINNIAMATQTQGFKDLQNQQYVFNE